MRVIYLDCGMGAAGDMLTAALLELHDAPEAVLTDLNRAFAGKAVLTARKERKCGIAGTHLTVAVNGEAEGDGCRSMKADSRHHQRTSAAEIREFISGLDLPSPVLQDAIAVYDRIADTEGVVHGCPIENIHFHETGTIDAMADVVSACYLIHELKPERIFASPVHVGSGTVLCSHGELPVPAPATQELLKEIPIYGGEIRGELCTPTGAALLKHFVSEFGNMPVMRVQKIGFGLGAKDFPRANGLRALLGDTENAPEQVIELSCNLDDMTGEELAFAQEQLFQQGALDVYFTNIGMKKSRPGVVLTCICKAGQREVLLHSLFRHTTSLGVRETICSRYVLNREVRTEYTADGPVRVKRAEGYGVVREKAEYEDLKRIAEEQNLTLREARELLD